MSLTKELILAAGRSKPVSKTIAALGGEVLIKRLTAEQAEDYYESVQGPPDAKGERAFVSKSSRAKLIALCVVGEDGAPLFIAEEANALDAPVVQEIFEACQEVNGLNKTAVEDAKKD
jgi:Phage tail assembly chaperone, TAC